MELRPCPPEADTQAERPRRREASNMVSRMESHDQPLSSLLHIFLHGAEAHRQQYKGPHPQEPGCRPPQRGMMDVAWPDKGEQTRRDGSCRVQIARRFSHMVKGTVALCADLGLL